MPSYYTYLIASLPALSFGMKPSFSLEEFFSLCARHIPETDLARIKEAVEKPDYQLNNQELPFLKKWHQFNLALRTELARLRAGRKKVDPLQYVREEVFIPSEVMHAANSAYRNLSLLDAEKILDLARWHFLEENSLGHFFDLETLIAYALKLKILWRWERINSCPKQEQLEKIIAD